MRLQRQLFRLVSIMKILLGPQLQLAQSLGLLGQHRWIPKVKRERFCKLGKAKDLRGTGQQAMRITLGRHLERPVQVMEQFRRHLPGGPVGTRPVRLLVERRLPRLRLGLQGRVLRVRWGVQIVCHRGAVVTRDLWRQVWLLIVIMLKGKS